MKVTIKINKSEVGHLYPGGLKMPSSMCGFDSCETVYNLIKKIKLEIKKDYKHKGAICTKSKIKKVLS